MHRLGSLASADTLGRRSFEWTSTDGLYVREVVNVQTAQVVSHDVMPKKEKYVFGIISRAQGELEAHISWVLLNH